MLPSLPDSAGVFTWGAISVMSEANNEKPTTVSRRRALARLGLAAGVAYAAPTVLPISRNRHAFAATTPCFQVNNNPNDNPNVPSCPP